MYLFSIAYNSFIYTINIHKASKYRWLGMVFYTFSVCVCIRVPFFGSMLFACRCYFVFLDTGVFLCIATNLQIDIYSKTQLILNQLEFGPDSHRDWNLVFGIWFFGYWNVYRYQSLTLLESSLTKIKSNMVKPQRLEPP